MPSAGPQTGVGLGAALAEALMRIDTPEFVRVQMADMGFIKQFGDLVTEPFTAGGLRMRYQTQKPRNAIAMGNTNRGTAVPDPVTGYAYADMVYQRAHFNDFVTSIVYDQALEDYIQSQGGQDNLDNIAAKLLLDTSADMNDFVNMQMAGERRAILGTVVACSTVTDDTTAFGDGADTAWTGRYTFTLSVGQDALIPAFKKGMALSVCAVPTNYGTSADTETGAAHNAAGDVRNYCATGTTRAPIIVEALPRVHKADANLGYVDLDCAMYYTAATKASVQDICDIAHAHGDKFVPGVLGTGDVITPYCGTLAATGTTKTQGANFGSCGLLELLSAWDIETVGGACSTVLKTTAGATVTRASGGNFGWHIPNITDAAAASITFAMLENQFIQLGLQAGGQADRLVTLINPLTWATLRDAIGDTPYRIQQGNEVASATQQRWGAHGLSVVTFQGIGTGPVVLHPEYWVPPNRVHIVNPSDFARMAPSEGSWRTHGTGSIWHDLRQASTSKLLMGSQAYYLRPFQMHLYQGFVNGEIMYTKP